MGVHIDVIELKMGYLLKKEGKNKQALMMLFEVIYFDVNGCTNVRSRHI